jgi:hypothetical protein
MALYYGVVSQGIVLIIISISIIMVESTISVAVVLSCLLTL